VPSSMLDKITAEFLEAELSASLAAALGRGLRALSWATSRPLPRRNQSLFDH